MRLLPCAALLSLLACSHNRDAEAQTVVDDLRTLDDAAEQAVRAAPDATGLANAEALIDGKQAALHARVLALQGASLTPPMSQTLVNAYAKNTLSAQNVRDDVYNAVLKTDPALRARAKKVGAKLCEICETPSYSTECAIFRNPMPGD